MTSTEAQDRDSRRARHAQRVAALREQRKQRGREPRTSVVSQLVDPFAAVQPDQELSAAEAVFPL